MWCLLSLLGAVVYLLIAPTQCFTPENEAHLLLAKTISALDAALMFFYREHKNVNLDAVIGTRMVEGKFRRCIDSIYYYQIGCGIQNEVRIEKLVPVSVQLYYTVIITFIIAAEFLRKKILVIVVAMQIFNYI